MLYHAVPQLTLLVQLTLSRLQQTNLPHGQLHGSIFYAAENPGRRHHLPVHMAAEHCRKIMRKLNYSRS